MREESDGGRERRAGRPSKRNELDKESQRQAEMLEGVLTRGKMKRKAKK